MLFAGTTGSGTRGSPLPPRWPTCACPITSTLSSRGSRRRSPSTLPSVRGCRWAGRSTSPTEPATPLCVASSGWMWTAAPSAGARAAWACSRGASRSSTSVVGFSDAFVRAAVGAVLPLLVGEIPELLCRGEASTVSARIVDETGRARAFGGLPELANAKLTPVLAPLRALDLVVGPDHLKRARRDRERLAQVGVETTLGQGRFSGMA